MKVKLEKTWQMKCGCALRKEEGEVFGAQK
jgi:hypothetical protein